MRENISAPFFDGEILCTFRSTTTNALNDHVENNEEKLGLITPCKFPLPFPSHPHQYYSPEYCHLWNLLFKDKKKIKILNILVHV